MMIIPHCPAEKKAIIYPMLCMNIHNGRCSKCYYLLYNTVSSVSHDNIRHSELHLLNVTTFYLKVRHDVSVIIKEQDLLQHSHWRCSLQEEKWRNVIEYNIHYHFVSLPLHYKIWLSLKKYFLMQRIKIKTNWPSRMYPTGHLRQKVSI